jgi:ATP-dependent Clp protease ATP-binding subunit ClpC
LTKEAKEFLVDKGFQPEMGARPLRRTIERYLEDPLSEIILLNPDMGRRCHVDVKDDHLEFIDDEVFPLHTNKDDRRKKKEKEKSGKHSEVSTDKNSTGEG